MLGSVGFSSPFHIQNLYNQLQACAPSPSQILDGAMTSVSLTLDKLCGTAVFTFAFINKMGTYLSSKDKTAEIARRFLEEESVIECPSLFSSEVACVPVSTGLNVTNFKNCSFNFPVTYDVHLIPSGSIDLSVFRSCIQTVVQYCLTNCMRCQNVYPGDPHKRIGSETFTLSHSSSYIKGRIWEIVTIAPEDIYQWNKDNIAVLMPTFLDNCDLTESLSKNNYLYIGLTGGVIGLVIVGLFGVSYWCGRTKGTDEEKTALLRDNGKDDWGDAELKQKPSNPRLKFSDDEETINLSEDENVLLTSDDADNIKL